MPRSYSNSFIFCDFLEKTSLFWFDLLWGHFLNVLATLNSEIHFALVILAFFGKNETFVVWFVLATLFETFWRLQFQKFMFAFVILAFFENFLAFSKKSRLETLEIVSFEHILKEHQRFFDKWRKITLVCFFHYCFKFLLTELIQFWSWHANISSQIKKLRAEFRKKLYFSEKLEQVILKLLMEILAAF